jgi:hypothetical protein
MEHNTRVREFYSEVIRMVEGGSRVLDSIVEFCESRGIEVENVVDFVKDNAKIVSLLQEESERSNSIQKSKRLPI